MEKEEVKETAKEHQAVRNLTQADAIKISKGELHSENHLIDQSLYGEKPLNPEGDDDHDGIKNKDEIYIYRKNNKEYVGYHSHPLLEDSDGDGLRDNEEVSFGNFPVSVKMSGAVGLFFSIFGVCFVSVVD